MRRDDRTAKVNLFVLGEKFAWKRGERSSIKETAPRAAIMIKLANRGHAGVFAREVAAKIRVRHRVGQPRPSACPAHHDVSDFN